MVTANKVRLRTQVMSKCDDVRCFYNFMPTFRSKEAAANHSFNIVLNSTRLCCHSWKQRTSSHFALTCVHRRNLFAGWACHGTDWLLPLFMFLLKLTLNYFILPSCFPWRLKRAFEDAFTSLNRIIIILFRRWLIYGLLKRSWMKYTILKTFQP